MSPKVSGIKLRFVEKLLWKHKYNEKIDRCIHTTRLLQTLAQLKLWSPSEEEKFALTSKVMFNNTLAGMVETLGNKAYRGYRVK